MTTVIGIDLGSSDTIVAYVGRGAVDIVRNEVSERKTPTVVGFTSANRLLGEGAQAQIKSNGANTCRFPKNLLGRRFNDAGMESELQWQLCPMVGGPSGEACYSVSYQGEQRVFTPAEVTAMLLSRLIETTQAFTSCRPKDCVISVPSFFSDIHRQALLDSARIANLNPLRVMNDHTATALGYGIYRTADFDETTPTPVAFCAMGHGYFSCSIVTFLRNQLTVLAEVSDCTVSGREIEARMMRKCSEVFMAKNANSGDPLVHQKAKFKLEEACSKAKKVLSANSEAGVNIECLIGEKDINLVFNRPDLEELCADMAEKIKQAIEKAVADSGIEISALSRVEVVGGCSRIPFVQKAISTAFGERELSRTLNADESVARGCALQAAILSPLFKVREFGVTDFSNHGVAVAWKAEGGEGETADADGDTVMEESAQVTGHSMKRVVVFPRKSKLGTVKVMSFYRTGSFDIAAEYAQPESLLPGTPISLGNFHVEIPSELLGGVVKVKVRAVLSIHGTFNIESAYAAVDEEVEELVKEEREKEGGEKETVEVAKKRMRIKKVDLIVTATGIVGFSPEVMQKLERQEAAMIISDNECRLRDVARNDLEAFIFATRSKVGGLPNANQLEDILTAAEDWVYDNYESGRAAFVDKLSELKEQFAFLKTPEPEAAEFHEAQEGEKIEVDTKDSTDAAQEQM